MATKGTQVNKNPCLVATLGLQFRAMKNEIVKIRVTKAEKQAFEKAAQLSGNPLSAWVRERLRRAATRELGEAGQQIAFLQSLLDERTE